MSGGVVADVPGRVRIKGKAPSVIRFFMISLSYLLPWILLTSELGFLAKRFGPQVLLQLNLAFYMPSIPILVMLGEIEKFLDQRVGATRSMWFRLNIGILGCVVLCAVFPFVPQTFTVLMVMVVAMGVVHAVAFSTSYQLVSWFRQADTIALGIGCVGTGPVVLLLQVALNVGPHPSRWQWIAMFEVAAALALGGLLSSVSLFAQYWTVFEGGGSKSSVGPADPESASVPLLLEESPAARVCPTPTIIMAPDPFGGGPLWSPEEDFALYTSTLPPASPMLIHRSFTMPAAGFDGNSCLGSFDPHETVDERLSRVSASGAFDTPSVHDSRWLSRPSGAVPATCSTSCPVSRVTTSAAAGCSAAAGHPESVTFGFNAGAETTPRGLTRGGEGDRPVKQPWPYHNTNGADHDTAAPTTPVASAAPAAAAAAAATASAVSEETVPPNTLIQSPVPAAAAAGPAPLLAAAAAAVPPCKAAVHYAPRLTVDVPGDKVERLTIKQEAALVMQTVWQVVVAFLCSVTVLYLIFPFFTYVVSSGALGDRLPQTLFFARIFADLMGRFLPRRKALLVKSPNLLLLIAGVQVLLAALFFVYLKAFPGLHNDFVFVAIVVCVWMAGGYINTCANILAPNLVSHHLAARASAIMALTFQVSHFTGLLVAILMAFLLYGDLVG